MGAAPSWTATTFGACALGIKIRVSKVACEGALIERK